MRRDGGRHRNEGDPSSGAVQIGGRPRLTAVTTRPGTAETRGAEMPQSRKQPRLTVVIAVVVGKADHADPRPLQVLRYRGIASCIGSPGHTRCVLIFVEERFQIRDTDIGAPKEIDEGQKRRLAEHRQAPGNHRISTGGDIEIAGFGLVDQFPVYPQRSYHIWNIRTCLSRLVYSLAKSGSGTSRQRLFRADTYPKLKKPLLRRRIGSR